MVWKPLQTLFKKKNSLRSRDNDMDKDNDVEIDYTRLPKHIALIMDGNGRWAEQRKLPRIAGHREGMKALKRIITYAHEIGLQIMTCYAFSTENWKRPQWEVDLLMRLPQEYLKDELPNLMEKNIQVRMLGEMERLPSHTRAAIEEAIEKTASNSGMVLNFAINYGGRLDIVHAVKQIIKKVEKGEITAEDVNEEFVSQNLYTAGLEEPDLLIRPGGEFRISNFLLWQIAYTELWFCDINWPDFKPEHLKKAIYDFQQRERRFGGIKV